jgi:ribosome modulation factor
MGNHRPGVIRKKGYEAYGKGLDPYTESPYETKFAKSLYLPIWLAGWHDAENDDIATEDNTEDYIVFNASDDEEGSEQCDPIGSIEFMEVMPDRLEINGDYYIKGYNYE